MPLQCNIDAKGKAIRMTLGSAVAAVGLILLIISAIFSTGTTLLIVGIAALLSGGFMIFEARAGWCVIRAMGWKTPI
ncbi:MAG TPA: hypothetical protein VHD56_12435 [Tepidisphaeraceae bacterium]|nr:hypothetical protein [Tepidisphaeraceae bacterium]